MIMEFDLSGIFIITCILLVRVVRSEMRVPEPDFTIGLRPDSEIWESNFIERLEKTQNLPLQVIEKLEN